MSAKYRVRQILAPLIGSLGVFCSGSSYVWVNPIGDYFLSGESPFNMTEEDLSWYGAVVEVGDVAATIPSGFLADHLGRKAVLQWTGPCLVATWILVQLTSSYSLLILSRILQGFVIGCIFTVTPIYLGEISDKKFRGMAGTLVQAMWYLGILFQYIFGPYLIYIPGINIVCLGPALVFSILISYCPETPRYCLMKNDKEKATNIFCWLYGNETDKSQLEGMLEEKSPEDALSMFVDFFKSRKCIKALMLVSVIAITNVTGVTAILSYSTGTFEKIVDANASLITVFMGSLSLISSFIVAMSVDCLGRRPLLLFSTICCSSVLLIGAVLMILDTGHVLQALCIAFYPSIMSIGPGTLTYALMAELFADKYRGTGSALITLVAAAASFLALKFYNAVENLFGIRTNLFIFSGISAFASIVVYKFVPETKGKTFEEIQRLL